MSDMAQASEQKGALFLTKQLDLQKIFTNSGMLFFNEYIKK